MDVEIAVRVLYMLGEAMSVSFFWVLKDLIWNYQCATKWQHSVIYTGTSIY